MAMTRDIVCVLLLAAIAPVAAGPHVHVATGRTYRQAPRCVTVDGVTWVSGAGVAPEILARAGVYPVVGTVAAATPVGRRVLRWHWTVDWGQAVAVVDETEDAFAPELRRLGELAARHGNSLAMLGRALNQLGYAPPYSPAAIFAELAAKSEAGQLNQAAEKHKERAANIWLALRIDGLSETDAAAIMEISR